MSESYNEVTLGCIDEIGSYTDGITVFYSIQIQYWIKRWTDVDFFFFLFQLAFEPFYTNDRWTQPR